MADGAPVGTMFAELGMDDTPYRKAQDKLFDKVSGTVKNIEQNYKSLADKTATAFENMQKGVSDQFDKLKGYAIAAGGAIADYMKRVFGSIGDSIKDSFGRGWDKVKDFFSGVNDNIKILAERIAAVWIVTKIWGEVAGGVLGTIFNWVAVLIIAWKSLNFVVGLFTGKSYQSDHIDALVEETKVVEALRAQLQLSTRDAQSYKAAMDRLGIGQGDITAVFDGYRTSLRDNQDELDRLGVAYKDANGKILDQRTVLENVKTKLDKYTEGWDRNQAATAIGMGSYEQINNYLKITQSELSRSRESLDIYHLGIGPETQEAVNKYTAAMLEFRSETKLMGAGISRAIADQIMPAFTSLANFFKGGWPSVVDVFRYSMASITSLLWGLKMSFDLVVDAIKGAAGALSDIFMGLAIAAARALTGDFAGAKNALVEGWENAKGRVSKTWQEMVADANKSSAAMKLAWGFDDRTASAKAAPAQGKAWESADDLTAQEKRKILQALSLEYKKTYEQAVEAADHAAKMQVLAGQNELNFALDTIEKKKTALNEWFNDEATAINKWTTTQEEADAKIRALNADYNKQWAKYENQKEETTVKVTEFMRKAFSSYVTWEKKQIEDLVEYQRTQGGKRVSISASLWDKIAQYETMTGTVLGSDQRNEIDVNALMEEYWGMSYEMAAFYSTIEGYEDEYRKHVFDWIDKEEKRLAAFYDDDVAAAKWAADEKGKIEYDLFKKKTDYIAQGFGQLQNSFEAMADIYADGSSDAKRWEEAAKAMEIAQRGVAVVQAVAAIATQGLGDPYTAFARVAAMTATMISLLASIGESVNGSSTTASSYSIATSSATTLGSEEGSQSVANSYAMLQDTYDMEYRELSGIYEEMKDLNDNITGLVTSIIQTGGVSQFASLSEDSLSGIAGFYESLWGSLGSWFGNFFGGIASSLFGGKTSYELSGAGVSVYGKSISDLLEGASVYGEYYNTVKKTKSGGLFGKDKISYQTYYEAMGGDTLNMFTLVYKNLSETMLEIAAGLGTDMSKTLAYTFSGFTVELKDLSTDEISEAISSAISAVGDTAVKSLFGDILQQYQQLNEGLLETAVRIIQDRAVIEYWLDKTNQAFEGTTTEAIAFSEALIDIAGSLEDLTDAMETYYDKFFTDSEKEAKLKEDLISSLGVYGYDLPGNRAGYRALVESDTITQEAYVALMQMAESADQYYSYLEDLA
jgi:hypothetical protein